MKHSTILLIFILSLQACKEEDSPADINQSEKKKVKVMIMADPGISTFGNPVAIQISGTNITTIDNVTSIHILEAEYPVGEQQTITVKPIKGSPDMYLQVSADLNSNNPTSKIADKWGKGVLTVVFYPEDIAGVAKLPREETGQIVLNDVPYPVVEIGTQLWTSRDYTGYKTGSIQGFSADTMINDGRFYTPEEAESIALPLGWRIPSAADLQKMRSASGMSLSNIALNGKWYTNTTNTNKLGLYPTRKSESNRLLGFYLLKNTDSYSAFGLVQDTGNSLSFTSFNGSIGSMATSLRFVRDK